MDSKQYMLEDIFKCHDQLATLNKPTLEFGFNWQLQDGIILYPQNGLTGYLSGLFKILFPDVPLKILAEDATPEVWHDAARDLPSALVVLCQMQSYLDHDLELDLAKLMSLLPVQLAPRVVTARQLGEFLPAGDKESRFYDYFRKTFFPADPASRKKITKAFGLFNDSLSIGTFLQILKRYLLKADSHVPIVAADMYFEKLFTLSDAEVIVDCGGFTGDTLQYYLEHVRKDFSAYYLFEPDPANFSQLTVNISRLSPQLAKKVKPLQKAVGHTPSTLSFTGAGALESRVDANHGSIQVESVPLDAALAGIRPTLIKMDLEGYEAFALLGARNTIKTCRPVLSICVYHYPHDLWELPLLVNSFVREYVFYLRAYNEMFDYVCYCIPRERLAAAENHKNSA